MDSETRDVVVGLIVFILVCLFFSWVGELMNSDNGEYYHNGSYLEEACPDCNQY